MAGKSFYSNEIKEFWPFQKVAQKVAIFLGYFFEKKFRLQPKKVAQMAKFRPIWSHCASGSLVANKHFIEIMAHQSSVSMKKVELQV